MQDGNDRIDKATLVIGGIILLAGVFFLFRPYLGFVGRVWDFYWSVVRQVAVGLALIVAGIAVVLGARRRSSMHMPEKGTRLQKSQDRVLSGVVGGLGDYFGIDHTIMRLGVVAIVLLLGIFWQALVAYVVLSIIVPETEGGPR